MAIAFDAKSQKAGSSNISWTHTPVGTPKAIVVSIGNTSSTDIVTGVTYGGVAMTEVSGSPLLNTNEASSVHVYFLGANIPTGARTVTVTHSFTVIGATCISLTATADTTQVQAVNVDINSTSVANPSDTLELGSVTCWVVETFMSGQDANSGITPLSGWTSQLEYDEGTVCLGVYSYNTVAADDVTIGWTQTADDAICIAVGIAEISSSSYTLTATVTSFTMDDFGVWLHKSNRTLPVTVATFNITTNDTALQKSNTVLPITVATFNVTTNNTALQKSNILSTITTAFSVIGYDVSLLRNRVLLVTVVVFNATANDTALQKANILNVITATFSIADYDVSLLKIGAGTVLFEPTTASFILSNKKGRLIHYVPLGLTPMHKKTLVLDTLVTQLQVLPEVATATRVLLSPINARKTSPYVGLIAGPEEIVVEDAANIRYELDVDLILLKRGQDIETMLDAVKKMLFDAALPITLGVLQVRIVGQEPVALIDDDKYSSTRIVTVITYIVTKGAF